MPLKNKITLHSIDMTHSKIRLGIFASGGGSNADKICAYFKNHPSIEVGLILSNNSNAGVIAIAQNHNIQSCYISKETWLDCTKTKDILLSHQVDFIILAGFLKLIPDCLITHWENKILNIHPSLLPKHGGKGMYGMHVHNAVKKSKEKVTGMTVHLVNSDYDKGKILFQAQLPVDSHMSPHDIAQEVLKLEHLHYSPTIEYYVNSL